MTSLKELHKINKQIFINGLYREGGGVTKACNVYDTIIKGSENCQDCLGENFNSLIMMIVDDFFTNYTPSDNTKLDFYFATYNFWLYTFVERIDFIFRLLNKDNQNKMFNDFQKNNFKTLSDIKKWMNFIKHPKEFLFCHWPRYVFDINQYPITDKVIIINIDFVRKHYSQTETKVDKLEKQDYVLVHVPDLFELTSNFCNELNLFFDFICKNEIVAQYLKLKTTIDYFYEPT